MDNACVKEFLDQFLNFIFLGNGVTIQTYIGRKASWYKGNDQELIVALMIFKCSLRNVRLFHMYLVVSKTKIKFSKKLGIT